MTGRQLGVAQATASRHLAFSLTLACPLRCAHCIVEGGPERRLTTMAVEEARRLAAQMPELYAHGIRVVSFTGGEPLLAREQLQVLASAAHAAGIVGGVVSSGYWATSERVAREVIAAYPGIRSWDVSTDVFHEPFVPLERVRWAHQVARDMGRVAAVRFTYHDPMQEADARILEFLGTFVAPGELVAQRVQNAGRAQGLVTEPERGAPGLMKPCMTNGLVVQSDGAIAPCCASLVAAEQRAFPLGNARERSLGDIHHTFITDPLLALIRVIGFGEVVEWLREAGWGDRVDASVADVCDLCANVMTNAEMSAYLARRAGAATTRLKLGVLARELFGEQQLLKRALDELWAERESVAGYSEAAALLEPPPVPSAP